MTKVRVTDGKLAIEVQGWDKLWSMTSRLEIPVEHVIDVRPADDPVGGLRMLGTHLPGVITAGTFLQEGSLVFWNVHDPAKPSPWICGTSAIPSSSLKSTIQQKPFAPFITHSHGRCLGFGPLGEAMR